MLFIIKITKYNLFYKYIKLQNRIYFFPHINIYNYKIQFILQTYTIYFFSHKYIQLQNRIHFTFTPVNI